MATGTGFDSSIIVASTSFASLVQVPADHQIVNGVIVVTNTSADDHQIYLCHDTLATTFDATTALLWNTTIPGSTSVEFHFKVSDWTVNSQLQAKSDIADKVNVRIYALFQLLADATMRSDHWVLQTTNSITTLATIAAGEQWADGIIIACNTSAADDQLYVYHDQLGSVFDHTTALVYNETIPAYSTKIFRHRICGQTSTETIKAKSVNGTVTVHFYVASML